MPSRRCCDGALVWTLADGLALFFQINSSNSSCSFTAEFLSHAPYSCPSCVRLSLAKILQDSAIFIHVHSPVNRCICCSMFRSFWYAEPLSATVSRSRTLILANFLVCFSTKKRGVWASLLLSLPTLILIIMFVICNDLS